MQLSRFDRGLCVNLLPILSLDLELWQRPLLQRHGDEQLFTGGKSIAASKTSPAPPDRVVVVKPTVFDNCVFEAFGTLQFLHPLLVDDVRFDHTPNNPSPSIRGILFCIPHRSLDIG
jgi:hypothetical protein